MEPVRVPLDRDPVLLSDRREAEAYVASVCFKHGPPRLSGVELEWTVHHVEDPAAALDVSRLITALGEYAPATLVTDSQAAPLPNGCLVSVEPGGQVEISSPASTSLSELLSAVSADAEILGGRLRAAGLRLGEHGVDPFRPPQRILHTPRYAAMEAAFASTGPDGLTMMCSTAGVQVCIDIGERERLVPRWTAVHALGPVMCALFGNTAAGSAWVSARQRAVFGSDRVRMRPAAVTADPAASWARRVVDAPVICVRSLGASWTPETSMSFAQWIDGGLDQPPSTADLDYHLTTMFPPVRPHGYIEVRYLDAQPGESWMVPVVLLTALFAAESTVDKVVAATAPAAGKWLRAARYGLADPGIAAVAAAVVDICVEAIAATDLDETLAAQVIDQLRRRVSGAPVAA